MKSTGKAEMNVAAREQQIRERAYAIWEGEGRPMDRAEAHWQQAEAEIADAPAPKRAASAKKRNAAGKAAAPVPRRRAGT